MATAQANSGGRKGSAETSSTETGELGEQLETLRADVAALANTVAGIGTRKAGDLKQKATDTSSAAARRMKDDFGRIEAGLSSGVRAHPLRSLAIAAGLGAAIGYLVRR